LQKNCTQAILVIKGDNLIGAAIVPNTDNPGVQEITPKSTAEALLLLTPFVAQGKKEDNAQVLDIIRNLTNLSSLESAISDNLVSIGKVCDIESPDEAFSSAFGNALNEIFANSQFRELDVWYINPTKASGLTIIEKIDTPADNDFTAINDFKRYVDIYDGSLLVASLNSKGWLSLYQPVRKDFQLSVNGRTNIDLSAYGIGINNIPPLGSEEMARLYDPVIKSMIFDIFLPVINILFGSYTYGNIDSIQVLIQKIFNDNAFIISLTTHISAGKWIDVGFEVACKARDIIFEDFSQNGTNSIIVKYLGKIISEATLNYVLRWTKFTSVLTKLYDLLSIPVVILSSNAIETFHLSIDTWTVGSYHPIFNIQNAQHNVAEDTLGIGLFSSDSPSVSPPYCLIIIPMSKLLIGEPISEIGTMVVIDDPSRFYGCSYLQVPWIDKPPCLVNVVITEAGFNKGDRVKGYVYGSVHYSEEYDEPEPLYPISGSFDAYMWGDG